MLPIFIVIKKIKSITEINLWKRNIPILIPDNKYSIELVVKK
jgi:hypothetical protein